MRWLILFLGFYVFATVVCCIVLAVAWLGQVTGVFSWALANYDFIGGAFVFAIAVSFFIKKVTT